MRNRALFGLKFRREHLVAGYCLDLYCSELRLCIEVDGPIHDDPVHAAHDAERTDALNALGIRVVRIAADRVRADTLAALVRPFLAHPAANRPSR